MRLVPHPVAIVTSSDPEAGPSEEIRGATISSLNTVTLEPDAIVSFNLKTPSTTYDAINASSKFAVHLLADTGEAGGFAHRFVKKADEPGPAANRGRSPGVILVDPENPSIPCWSIGSGRPPLLQHVWYDRNRKEYYSVKFVFECAFLREQSPRIADHIIVLGKVVNVFRHRALNPDDEADRDEACLSYGNGWYKRMIHVRKSFKRLTGLPGHERTNARLEQTSEQTVEQTSEQASPLGNHFPEIDEAITSKPRPLIRNTYTQEALKW